MFKIGGQKIPMTTKVLVVGDACLVSLGLCLAILIRLHDFGSTLHYFRLPDMPFRFGIVLVTCGISLYYNDLYASRVVNRRSELFVYLFQAVGTAWVILAILYYLIPDHSLGRGIAVLSAPIVLLFLLSWRLILLEADFLFPRQQRVLVVGTGPLGISLVREILHRPELHMKVVGFLDENGENIGKSLVNPGIIGATRDLEEITSREKIDRIVLSLRERRGQTPVRELLHLKFAGVAVEDAHTVSESIDGRIRLEYLSPSWMILSEGFRKSALLLAAKRMVDIVVSVLLLLVTLPIMGIVALAIWLESGSPILFRQERIGLGGRPFQILKFRSMKQNAEEHGPKWAADGDHRVTRIGRIIRKLRLDELPQAVNVLRGEMSFVGPRPERAIFCRMLENETPFYALRYSVRPGITGWAQVKYQYGASIEEAKTKLEYDLFYIKHLSLTLDLAILFETAKVVLWQRGAK
ncbi:MAG TPA: TIGR03013 family XrtA/PEP-CTERM system glycosyltransferase [Candidatus Acidoferrum sp.]|nr:TIGR03013 family XrtA/PEP-CTERM system glycosyltransferase [Candidatus Acidoferrum sp.]